MTLRKPNSLGSPASISCHHCSAAGRVRESWRGCGTVCMQALAACCRRALMIEPLKKMFVILLVYKLVPDLI